MAADLELASEIVAVVDVVRGEPLSSLVVFDHDVCVGRHGGACAFEADLGVGVLCDPDGVGAAHGVHAHLLEARELGEAEGTHGGGVQVEGRGVQFLVAGQGELLAEVQVVPWEAVGRRYPAQDEDCAGHRVRDRGGSRHCTAELVRLDTVAQVTC